MKSQLHSTTELIPDDPGDLQFQFLRKIVLAEDNRYDEARSAWNLSVDQRPAAILFAGNEADISQGLIYAADHNLDVAVQSTGHGVIKPADNCLLILTSQLNEIQIDTSTQTAYIGAGAKWGQVLERTQQNGFAPLLGSSPDVGVAGYTLGGGMGWLARKYGLAADSVQYFDVVTADGELLRASATENSDLFWGLKGGGGSLGIVTGMEIRLYPLTSVYGGNLIYPIEIVKEVFENYRDWIVYAPDELTSSIVIMNFPRLTEIPEALRGKSTVMVRGCYCGSIEQGESLFDVWRKWHSPMIDDFKAMPFSQVASISNDPVDPVAGFSTGAWIRELSDEAVRILIQYGVGNDGNSPIAVTEVHHAGGAIARVNPDLTAYSHRNEQHILQIVGLTPTVEARQYLQQYLHQFKTDLAPHFTGNVYMNFLEGDESRERIQDAYSTEAFQRLKEIKRKYDPDNRLCYSFDISPANGS
jgi:FAD/FMN-containing dehydrogenase